MQGRCYCFWWHFTEIQCSTIITWSVFFEILITGTPYLIGKGSYMDLFWVFKILLNFQLKCCHVVYKNILNWTKRNMLLYWTMLQLSLNCSIKVLSYDDIIWMLRYLRSTVAQLFKGLLMLTTKETPILSITVLLWGESAGDQCIPLTTSNEENILLSWHYH